MKIPILVYERVLPDDIDGYKAYFNYYTVVDGIVYTTSRVNMPSKQVSIPVLCWNTAIKGTDEYARATIARAVGRGTGFLQDRGTLYYPQWVNVC